MCVYQSEGEGDVCVPLIQHQGGDAGSTRARHRRQVGVEVHYALDGLTGRKKKPES